MSKQRIDEGVMKYIVKLFFPFLEKRFLQDPEIQKELREVSKLAAEMNENIRRIEELTGKDLSDLYLKHK